MSTDLPWGLQPCEAKTVQALIDTGSNKGAARVRGRSLRTVETQMARALE